MADASTSTSTAQQQQQQHRMDPTSSVEDIDFSDIEAKYEAVSYTHLTLPTSDLV